MSQEDILLRRGLADIRKQIEDLHLASAAYAAIGITENEYFVVIIDDDTSITVKQRANGKDKHEEILNWIRKYTAQNNMKIVAAALLGSAEADRLGSELWLSLDIVPVIKHGNEPINETTVQEAARTVSQQFDEHNLVKVVPTDTNEVIPSFLVTLKDYEKTVPQTAWAYLHELSQEFRERNSRMVFFNATPQGGGVALMRHAQMRLYRLLGLDIHWHAMQPNAEVFEITKTKLHNVLQAVAPEGVELTDHDKQLYSAWSSDNAEHFKQVIQESNVIVIDDPQPSGMMPYIKEHNPEAPLMYRSHIHLDNELLAKQDTPQQRTWDFLWQNIKLADTFISHPIERFIPHTAAATAVAMPAATDPLDGLNKPLTETDMDYYLGLFNKILLEHAQKPLDRSRPYIVQIARFDPSKGIPDVIEAYVQLRKKLGTEYPVPQLVLAGHGSIDDPDGVPVYNMTMRMCQEDRYRPYAEDIKVVRLHHNDQILNALMRGSKIALQLSHREGFEVKVTEALHKGKPVIAFEAGGIPLQIKHETTGYLEKIGDVSAVAQRLYDLLTDEKLYERMSQSTTATLNPNYFTVYNAIKWLYLANRLRRKESLPGNGNPVGELIGAPLAY
ncbi:MAG: glycosyltransferase [Candidatus Andersenbacteria bacterium]